MRKIKYISIIVFLLVLTGSLSACHVEVGSNYGGDLETIHEKTFPIQPGKNLKVEASSGDVTLPPGINQKSILKFLVTMMPGKRLIFLLIIMMMKYQ